MTRFRVLGPLSVQDIPVPTRMLRRLLMLLLSQANTPLSMESIIDALWDGDPPRTAKKSLIVYIFRLRQLIGGDRIGQELGGYVLHAAIDELDAALFDHLVDEAAAAAGRGEPAAAGDLLDQALGLWQGPAYPDACDIAAVAREADRLADRRARAVEQKAQLDLDLGQHVAVAADLVPFIAEHPYRERLRALLMLALYRGGRQAEALDQYRRFHHQLADELGIDPSPELQRLHRRILGNDTALLSPTRARAATALRFLPRDMRDFVGRRADLAWLDGTANGPAAPIVISAIAGTAGVGKTALAVHWAHRATDRFPDGQLYVNLRGYDPAEPLTPIEALTHLLRCLDVPPDKLHQELDVAAAIYRATLAGKRMLILLDNARTADQVRPLLPAEPGCVVVITSRDKLSGLIASDGAQRMTLGMLAADEALDLLRRIVGGDRVAGEPDAVQRLIGLCGGLPLALRIASAHLADRPQERIERYVAELTGGSLVAALRVDEDEHRGLGAVLTQSYEQLSPPAAQLFRLLGLHPGPDIGIPATASLAGLPAREVAPLLDELSRAHLIEEPVAGRYAFHDLIRGYAAEQAHKYDPSPEREAAQRRLLDHYLHTAHAADKLLHPVRIRLFTLPRPVPGVTPEALADRTGAVAWFTAEVSTLLAVTRHADQAGLDGYVYRFAWCCDTFLDWHGYWHEMMSLHRNAIVATARQADIAGQAFVIGAVARACIRLRRYDDADRALRQSLELLRQIDDRVGQGNAHMLFSLLREHEERDIEAFEHNRIALELFEGADTATRARCLNSMAWSQAKLGDHRSALRTCEEALALLRTVDDPDNHAATWDTLGYAHHHLGHHAEAVACYEHALARYREIGNRYYESCTLDHLGDTHHAAGHHERAGDAWQRALGILTGLDHPDAVRIHGKLIGLHPR